jgi:hypothetical protein
MVGTSSLRASDSDRDGAAERLRHATAEGRLTPDELEERLEVLYRSRTYGELDALVADLPARRPPRAVRPRPWWLGAAVAGAVLFALLGILGGAVTHSTHAVPRPGLDPHHLIIVASTRVAVVGIMIACAVLAWAFLGSRGARRS